jgi:hypothetical protein
VAQLAEHAHLHPVAVAQYESGQHQPPWQRCTGSTWFSRCPGGTSPTEKHGAPRYASGIGQLVFRGESGARTLRQSPVGRRLRNR